MNIRIRNFALGAALAACAVTASAPAMARGGYGDDTAAVAIGAGVVGLALGAALADRGDRYYYNRDYYGARRYVTVRGRPGYYYYYDGYPNRYYQDRYYDRYYAPYYRENWGRPGWGRPGYGRPGWGPAPRWNDHRGWDRRDYGRDYGHRDYGRRDDHRDYGRRDNDRHDNGRHDNGRRDDHGRGWRR